MLAQHGIVCSSKGARPLPMRCSNRSACASLNLRPSMRNSCPATACRGGEQHPADPPGFDGGKRPGCRGAEGVDVLFAIRTQTAGFDPDLDGESGRGVGSWFMLPG